MATIDRGTRTGRTIAIFPWGEAIEEFLDPLNLDLNDFVSRMTGGWLFGYVLALQGQGWRPIIVCASERVGTLTRLEHAGTGATVWAAPAQRSRRDPITSLGYLERWLKSPMRDFRTVLTKERCAAIIAQEYEYFRFDLLCVLARRTRCPIYATFQGGDVTLSPIERILRPWFLRHCSGLIVASARERARLAAAYPRVQVPIASIPNPLDCEEWRPEDRVKAREQLGLSAADFIVINHGRTDIGRKGLDILVAAWKLFSARHPEARAFVIGSGQDHAAFARLLEEQAPERMTWIADYITDRAQMRRWLSAADVYLTTSRTEGMPVAPLEAMACGLPIVSSDAHGFPDIFAAGEGDGGIVTPREDVSATVAALDRLVADPTLRARLGSAARRRVEEHFSIAAVGAALDQFVRQNRKERTA
ncbi:glycosyltransferase family 4 protein [Dongia deserti]|uniref:glycosyltransferase family 4 protein n=1 Tax=Dongia deserti TaxID=2268030 RepID=UPI000E655BDF|nr:glycosyltransferase family 4 protein [Dongia deserti]